MKKKYSFSFFCFCLLNIVSYGNNIGALEVNPSCVISAPTNNNNCSTPLGTVNLGGLPSGTWTLHRSMNNAPAVLITGSGVTHTETGLIANNCYSYTVTDSNGCTSSNMSVCVGYLNGLSGTMTGTYVDYNSDGITNLGDVIRYNLTINNGTICPVDVTYSFGSVAGSTGNISNLAVGATDTSGVLDYVLTQADINSGSVSNWIALEGLSPNGATSYAKIFMPNSVTLTINDGIRLNAFFDTNNNGIQNAGELNATTGFFNYELNNNGVTHVIYSSSGTNIIYETTPTNSYNLSFGAVNYCDGQNYSSATIYNNIHVAAGSGITTYNFPITASQCQDVQVHLYGMFPRAGSNFTNSILYANYGNQTLTSGTITFTKDSSLTITSVSEPSAVITPTGFTYNFTNLLPNQYRFLNVTMSVPPIPTVNIGDLITNSTTVTIPAGDVNPLNNSDIITSNVVGSYDPNYKFENHGGKIVYSTFTSNDYLTYTIQFENTGNANAINIRVNDILDNKLDQTSIKMINASHGYVLERINNILNWKFNGINLPPSNGSATVGHGYIVFQIKPKAGYAIGDIIRNDANIYFDSNPAITTDACFTEFVQALNTNNFAFSNFSYFPNPIKNSLSISNSSIIDTIEITSVLGQKIVTKPVNDLQTEIDLSDISKGIYFVKVASEGHEKVVKIIKE